MKAKKVGLIVLMVFALVLSGMIGYQFFKPGEALAAANSPVGSWKVVVTPADGPSFTDIANFSTDGNLTIMENDGRMGLGLWQKLSGNKYAFFIWEYYLENGTPLQVKVSSTIELNDGKEQYTGSFSVEVYDTDGNLLGTGGGTAIGGRLHVEP